MSHTRVLEALDWYVSHDVCMPKCRNNDSCMVSKLSAIATSQRHWLSAFVNVHLLYLLYCSFRVLNPVQVIAALAASAWSTCTEDDMHACPAAAPVLPDMCLHVQILEPYSGTARAFSMMLAGKHLRQTTKNVSHDTTS